MSKVSEAKTAFGFEEAMAASVTNRLMTYEKHLNGKPNTFLEDNTDVLETLADSILASAGAEADLPKDNTVQVISEDFKEEVRSGNWPAPAIQFKGRCLICGKTFQHDDYILMSKSEGHAICLDCCDDGNSCDYYENLIVKVL